VKISKDEGWREIREAFQQLLEAYGCDSSNVVDYLSDVESDMESFVREYGNN
jgi:hypothetical protein